MNHIKNIFKIFILQLVIGIRILSLYVVEYRNFLIPFILGGIFVKYIVKFVSILYLSNCFFSFIGLVFIIDIFIYTKRIIKYNREME